MKIIRSILGLTPSSLVILSMILGTIFDSVCLFFFNLFISRINRPYYIDFIPKFILL